MPVPDGTTGDLVVTCLYKTGSPQIRYRIKDMERSQLYSNAWGSIDPNRDEYSLWIPCANPTATFPGTGTGTGLDGPTNPFNNLTGNAANNNTLRIVVGLSSGLSYQDYYTYEITSCDPITCGGQGDVSGGYSTAAVLGSHRRGIVVGIQTVGSVDNGTFILTLTEEGYRSDRGPFALNTQSCYAETDWQDMDLPGVEKTISHAILWATTDESHVWNSGTFTITCTNGEGTTVSATKSVTTSVGVESPTMFSFTPKSGEAWKFKISATQQQPGAMLTRLVVYYQATGESEAARDLTP